MQLLKIEWLKIKNYPAFWWATVITALSYIGASYATVGFYHNLNNNPTLPKGAATMLLGNPFAFNEVWHTIAYISSLFIIIPALVVIMLITNEYTFKTHRQNIIDGWSRASFLTGKLLDILLISLLITFLYIGVCLIIGTMNTSQTDVAGVDKMNFIGHFFLQTCAQLSIAFVIGFLVRKSFIALGIFIFSSVILEPLLLWVLNRGKSSLGNFLPFEISDRMIPPPSFMAKMDPASYTKAMENAGSHVFYTIAFTLLLWAACFYLNSKRDL